LTQANGIQFERAIILKLGPLNKALSVFSLHLTSYW